MKFETAYFESAAGTPNQLPAPILPEIVFSGRSNVGKSSLINKVLNRKSLARVSAQPGKTGTINFYNVQDARLVDLPGYGYAKVSQSEKVRWAQLVEGYFGSERNIKLVVQIVDMRHKPTADDLHMIGFLHDSGLPFLIALTKSDKLNKTERMHQMAVFADIFSQIPEIKLLPFSAVTGEGAEELKSTMQSVAAQ